MKARLFLRLIHSIMIDCFAFLWYAINRSKKGERLDDFRAKAFRQNDIEILGK